MGMIFPWKIHTDSCQAWIVFRVLGNILRSCCSMVFPQNEVKMSGLYFPKSFFFLFLQKQKGKILKIADEPTFIEEITLKDRSRQWNLRYACNILFSNSQSEGRALMGPSSLLLLYFLHNCSYNVFSCLTGMRPPCKCLCRQKCVYRTNAIHNKHRQHLKCMCSSQTQIKWALEPV